MGAPTPRHKRVCPLCGIKGHVTDRAKACLFYRGGDKSNVSQSADSKVSQSAPPPVAARLQQQSNRETSAFSDSPVPKIVQESPVGNQKINFCSSSNVKETSVRSSSSSTDSNSISTEGTYLYMEMRTALLE